MNGMKVFILMAALTALVVGAGQVVGGNSGATTALMVAGLLNFLMYFFSHRLVLAMYGAKRVTQKDHPDLFRMVSRLRMRAGLPMPTLAIAPHEQPNAFATGRSPRHAVVCVTEGLLKTVTPEELEGVIAHELAHIKNRDMLIATVGATMAGAIGLLARIAFWFGDDDNPVATILLIVIAPIAALIINMAISRQREFEADRVGARIAGKPLALASALRKLEAAALNTPMQVAPAAAPLAQVNPLAAHGGGGLTKWFSTHPPTADRIAKLEAMSKRM